MEGKKSEVTKLGWSKMEFSRQDYYFQVKSAFLLASHVFDGECKHFLCYVSKKDEIIPLKNSLGEL